MNERNFSEVQAQGRCSAQLSFGILDSPTELSQQRPSPGGPLPDDFSGLAPPSGFALPGAPKEKGWTNAVQPLHQLNSGFVIFVTY
jgi:hypothetical protein